MKRRTLVRIRAANPQKGVWDEVTEIIKSLGALQNDPYVAATIAALQLFGAISSMVFQDATTSMLSDIDRRIREIDAKLTLLLEKLPEMIRRGLAEHEKTDILLQLDAKRSIANGVVDKYADKRPMARADIDVLKAIGRESLELGLRLTGYGPDTSLGLFYAYSLYRFTVESCGETFPSQKTVRLDFLRRNRDLRHQLEDLLDEAKKRLQETTRPGTRYGEIADTTWLVIKPQYPVCGVRIARREDWFDDRPGLDPYSVHSIYCGIGAKCSMAGFPDVSTTPWLWNIPFFERLRADADSIGSSATDIYCRNVAEMVVAMMNEAQNRYLRARATYKDLDAIWFATDAVSDAIRAERYAN